MSETISDEILNEALTKVGHLQRITPGERLDDEMKGPTLFGNNFYMLFIAMREKKSNPDHPLVHTYLLRAEKLGKPWQDFLAQNEDLLTKIDAALADYEIYNAVLELCIDLANVQDQRAEQFKRRIDPNLGLNAIAIPIFRKLNPLLQAAAHALQQLGIEPFELKLRRN